MKHSAPVRFAVRGRLGAVYAASVAALSVTLMVAFGGTAQAATAPVPLGTAASFAVLAGSEVTNTGPSTIAGDLGVSAGSAITGFPPGLVTDGTQHSADAVAAQAQSDLTTAYNNAAGRTPPTSVGVELGGQTLPDGIYENGTLGLTGTLTLDGQGDPSSVWIFQAGSTLITASGSRVALINGADACNVFWQIGSSATLGTGTSFIGTVMALTSITANTGVDVQGRLLARNGAVTLDTTDVDRTGCAATPAEPPTTTTEPPPTTTEPPTTTTEPPPTTTEPPTTTSDDEQPPTTTDDEQPPTTTTDDEQPPTTTTDDEQPPTTTDDEQPPTTTDDDQPTTDDEQPSTTTSDDDESTTTTTEEDESTTTTTEEDESTTTTTEGDESATTTTDDEQSSTTTRDNVGVVPGGGTGTGTGTGGSDTRGGAVVIPRGFPHTGVGGASGVEFRASSAVDLSIAVVALTGAILAAGHALRRRRHGDAGSGGNA